MLRTLICIGLCLATPAWAQTRDEIALARAILSDIQPESIRRNREYCGVIGYDAAGRLVATKPRRGRRSSCRIRRAPAGMTVTASYHTHAAYHAKYDNEVPSMTDVEGDMADGINGFVATPGGRFWAIDGETGQAWLICGQGCMPFDANYRPDLADPVAELYDLDALYRRAAR